MPNGWVWCRLVDITSVVGDGLHGTPQYNPNGAYYFVNGNNLSNRKILIKDSTKRVSKEEYIKYKKPLNEHTILVSINGTIGNVATYSNEKIILGKSACYFNITPFLVKEYMCYVIESNYFQKYALLSATGSTIKNVPLKAINEFNVPIPPVSEQKRIVSQIDYLLDFIYKVESEKLKLQDTIKQVKRKILDLAIHGKLVPQDPADEPASELLKRVNPNAEITSDNEHYPQLPAGWCIAPMKILCSLEDGRKEKNNERFNIDVKFLRGERNAKIINNGRYICANSLLILVDGENSGEVFRTPIEGYQGSTFKRLIINELMCEEYLLNVISLHRKVLRENKVGSAIPHLNKKLFKEIEVPIPPYNEQKRIAEAIKNLFNNIDNIAENL